MKLAPPLPEWVTLGEAVDWLNANTPLEWTWRRVLETLKAQYPETLHVVPPLGLHLAKPDQCRHLDNITCQYPQLVQASQAGEYLRQLLLGDFLETATGITGALVDPRGYWRAIPIGPIPASALRLSRHEVYALSENADGFDVLVEELQDGKHPDIAELLDAWQASKPNEGLPMVATPDVAIDPPPLPDPADTTQPEVEAPKPNPERRKTEINRWLMDTWVAEGRPGGTEFFRKLRKYRAESGSPIVEWWQSGPDAGIEFETSAGNRKSASRKAILNKVSGWKKTAITGEP